MPIGDNPKKLTLDAKAAIQLVYEDLGGTQRMLEWANNPANLGVFYTQIWSKIIPKDIKAEVDGNITIEIQKFGEDHPQLMHPDKPVIETLSTLVTDAITSSIEDDDNGET